jgi:hypothetical protein
LQIEHENLHEEIISKSMSTPETVNNYYFGEAKLLNNQIRHYSPPEDSKEKTLPPQIWKVTKKIQKFE